MSWQTYVDDHLLCQLPHGGVLSAAAIVGQDGGVWAQNDTFPELVDGEVPSFDLPPRCMHMGSAGPRAYLDCVYAGVQVAKIVRGFDDTSELAANGLWLGGEKFMLLAGEPGAVIRGRGKENKSKGVTIKKTVSAIVFGIYEEGVQPADCNTVVEGLGDYLVGQGM